MRGTFGGLAAWSSVASINLNFGNDGLEGSPQLVVRIQNEAP